MVDADAAGTLQAEAVEVIGELPAVARAGAAQDQVRQDGGRAEAVDRVGRGAGLQQQRHRRRLHAGHLLAQQGQPVREGMLEVPLSQFLATPFGTPSDRFSRAIIGLG